MFSFNLFGKWTPERARERLRTGNVPHEMRVAGRLDLSNSGWLTQLPRVLEAGSIDVSDCPRLLELPPVMKCTELMLRRTHIKRLPDASDVALRIDASECECLQVVGALRTDQLVLRGCTALVHLADRIRVRNLDLSSCRSLTELPVGLVYLRTLNLRGCTSLSSLPYDMRVQSWIEVADSGIESLPVSLSSTAVLWRGVRVSDRVAFNPETITVREILRETNVELRRVLLERVGKDWFCENARPEVMDSDTDPGGERRLLRVSFDEEEDFVCLEVRCPSTGRKYLLRVPPQINSCAQAAAWAAGFRSARQYRPFVET
jgi:hypothetical protein